MTGARAFLVWSRLKSLFVTILLVLGAQSTFGHGVQVGYGILPNGFIRLYVEHWHRDHPGLANSPLSVTTTTPSGSTTATYNAQGEVPNTAWNNLPLVGANIVILGKCGSANRYNDWLYWDFPPGSCDQAISITVNAGLTAVTTEECSTLYPLTISGQVFTDQGAPTLNCPNVTAVGTCNGANVNFAVSAVDDCDPNPVISYSHAPGSFFPVGTTPVTVTARDRTGKTSTCTFNVTVSPPAPTISCPGNITVNAAPGSCDAVVSFAATANCPGTTISYSRPPGSVFSKGVTTVNATATDALGRTASCSFSVTVIDTQPPTISGPATINVSAAPGATSAVVNYASPVGVDNCPGVVTARVAGLASGSLFPLGTTVNTFVVTDAVGLTASFSISVTVNAVDAPPSIVTSGAAATYTEGNPPVPINPDLTVTDVDGPNLNGAKVTISGGFVSGQDVLSFTPSGGISGSYNAGSGVLSLSGSASAAAYQTVLRSVAYQNTSLNPNTAPRAVTFSLGESTLFNSVTGHYYEFKSAPGITWHTARNTAAAQSLFGLPGYLATITSAQENGFVAGKLQGVGWIGGTDETAEGIWRWATGPEAGLQFWQGLSNGGPVGGQYANWNGGEPNNCCGGENFAHMIFNPAIGPVGSWNDLPDAGGGGAYAVAGYLIEYGGLPGDPVLQLSASAAVNVIPVNNPPTISPIPNLVTSSGVATGPQPFTIGDVDTPIGNLTLVAASSDAGLIPPANISIAGSGANRTISITPALGCGIGSVTVTVSDGFLTASTSFQVTVNDNIPPAITCPANIVVGNDPGACSAVVHFLVTGSDNCGAVTIVSTPASGTAFSKGTTTVQCTATDSKGNSSVCSFSVTVNDTQPPSISGPANIITGNSPGQAGAFVSYAPPVGTDNCPGAVTAQTLGLSSGSLFPLGTTVNAFVVTDAAGLSASHSFTVTVIDTEPPVITLCPPATTAECDGAGNIAAHQAWLNSFAAVDNSGQFTLSISQGAGGSTSTKSFPNFADLSEFQLNGTTALLGNPIYEGSNPVLRLTSALGQSGSAFLRDPISLAADASFSTQFSFQIDNNVNSGADGLVFVVQTVSNTAGGGGGGIGYLGIPNSIGVEFDTWDNGAVDGFNGSHIGIDVNGSINSVLRKNISPNLDSGVAWTAWVDYDGAADRLEVRLSSNNSRPAAPDLSYNIDLISVLGQTAAYVGFTSGTGGAASHHDILSWEFNNSFKPIGAPPCGGTSSETITFTATDAAGNSTSCTSTFAIVDTTAPAIGTAAASLVVETDGAGNTAALNAWLASHGGASATDACGSVTWTRTAPNLSDDCGATGSTVVTFTATDACGNSSSTTAAFAIVDTVPPSINAQAVSQTVECDGAGNGAALSAWLAGHGGASATDVGGAVTWTHDFTSLSDECGATGSAVVKFTATDACGNSSSTSATFAIVDTTAPTIGTSASSLVVETDGAGNASALNAWLANHGGAGATDGCGSVTWTHSTPNLSDDCGATGSTVVTFTATDACGNSSSTTAAFTIVDTVPPSINASAVSQTVECDGAGNGAALSAWLAGHGGASATDVGGAVTWTHDFTSLSDGCGATGSAVVKFTATDECGNSSSTSATFTIVDTTAPVVAAASNQTVECDGAGNGAALSAWLANHGGATAGDTCGSVTWTHNFTGLSDACGATGSAQVTFTATDECGNAASTTATFTIIDTTAPVIQFTLAGSNPLQVLSGSHGILPSSGTVTIDVSANDICGNAQLSLSYTCQATNSQGQIIDKSASCKVVVVGNQVSIVQSGGVGTFITIRAVSTDDCGNVKDVSLIVIVERPANEGVGNGVDGNTPGDVPNGGNDAPGTSPGNPGAKSKK